MLERPEKRPANNKGQHQLPTSAGMENSNVPTATHVDTWSAPSTCWEGSAESSHGCWPGSGSQSVHSTSGALTWGSAAAIAILSKLA